MDIELNTLRSAVTVLAFISFVGIFLWAWSGRNRARFDEAQSLPFADEGIAGNLDRSSAHG